MKKLLLVLMVVALASFLFVGCTPGTTTDPDPDPDPDPTPAAEITATITVDTETPVNAEGKTYVQGGHQEITVTFSEAVGIPTVKVGTVDVPMFPPTADTQIVWKGTGNFVGSCEPVLITVGGVCEDLCAAKSVVVDSVAPVISLEATVEECDCDEGYQLVVTSTGLTPSCGDATDCCGDDDCSGLGSVLVEIYTVNNEVTYPWELCCDLGECAELIGSDDSCSIEAKTECIPAVFTQSDGWVDFFDGIYYVKAVLEDNAGNVNTYYGEVTATDKDTVSFRELFVDPVTCDWCYAEALADVDAIIGDCEPPAVECWDPKTDCPEVTLVPAEPIVGQEVTITIDYTDAKSADGAIAAYVGPSIKSLPMGIPEGSQELVLTQTSVDPDPKVYTAPYTFHQDGTDYIYIVDGCGSCSPCKTGVTVEAADVCPVVEFLDNTFVQGDVPGYGLTNVNFTVTFANEVEKELVDVYVGIPGLAPFAMPFEMSPLSLEVPMTTTDEITYNGSIPIGDLKVSVVNWVNHYFEGPDPYDWVDSDEPFASVPALELALHALGCVPLEITVLAGDPCCIETCEYPFIVDPVGPYASLEVTIDTCEIVDCLFPGSCDPCTFAGHKIVIDTLEPEDCDEIGCCGDTCSGVASWTAEICPCDEDPFDECCEFVGCQNGDCIDVGGPWSGTSCDVGLATDCLFDLADPYAIFEDIGPDELADYWDSNWYLYVEMVDKAGNVTEYKAEMTINTAESAEDWTVTLDALCEDGADGTFGSEVCNPKID